ncbi:uncharacterized protein LY89DRAFT_699403 [Mollisia scopiformis]|uniref:DUF1996 domain-containing protein n=1 Tax=Mollisia scopiformis TaxID=149040 RepID=A0A194WXN5_MOLSC|nr:uncharacterized protein LY89DRAFT_699403 [Mollisia scopiformis]KUJ12746.1 hypothetical protein LY89DRAFT_699403 [Mollisia scopiformis]
MIWSGFALTALIALFAQNALTQTGSAKGSDFLRFACSQLVIERTDPLVNPGVIPSSHMHQVVGGSSFNATMDPAVIDPSTTSSCTSCKMSEDFSNYWTASIFFQSPENGTFIRVPQMANGRLNGSLMEQQGGLTVYYMHAFSGTNKNVTVFPRGFRMLAGDPTLRTKQSGPVTICHRCLAKNERTSGGSGAPCSSTDYASFPPKPCPGGIRATVIFPSCWDGKNLDSPDHRTHVTYQPGSALAGDKCPSTHPVRIPQVMYEIMYDTSGFADPKYYTNGKQPLVYSFGDPLGYGAHGDYLFGWKDGALQRAMDALGTNCFSETCPVLKLQSWENTVACTKAQQAKENTGTDTCMYALSVL